jgi:hypothetical protein
VSGFGYHVGAASLFSSFGGFFLIFKKSPRSEVKDALVEVF